MGIKNYKKYKLTKYVYEYFSDFIKSTIQKEYFETLLTIEEFDSSKIYNERMRQELIEYGRIKNDILNLIEKDGTVNG